MTPVRLPRLFFSGKRCPQCGYDLRSSRTGRCPECGTAYSPRSRGKVVELQNLVAILSSSWRRIAIVAAFIHFTAVIGLWIYLGSNWMGVANPPPRVVVMWQVVLVLMLPLAAMGGLLGGGCFLNLVLLPLNSLLWGAVVGLAYVGIALLVGFCRERLRGPEQA